VGENNSGEPQANPERLTVAQAAASLGITEGAVRSRIKRGTLPTAKEGGTVFVLLGGSTSQANQSPNIGVPGDQSELIASLQDQVRYLREQLDAERETRTEERRRHDTVVAQLTSRIPAIEAPQEAQESTESSGPTGELGELREELDTERTRREMAESTLRKGMDEERRRREEAERERDDLRRELFARREPRESPQTVAEERERVEPRPTTVESQEGVQRPWWRRVFGR
jgi:hypothetical protein